MANRAFTPTALILAIAAGTALSGCLAGPPPADVLGTFYPTYFLAQAIAGDLVDVGQLTPPGVEPHDWEPSAGDVSRLQDAKLVVAQTPRLEAYLDGLLGGIGRGAPDVVYGARAHAEWAESGIPPSASGNASAAHDDEDDHGHGHGDEGHAESDVLGPLPEMPADPHTWLDPVLITHEARVVGAALAVVYPQHEAEILNRTAALVDRLEDLHASYSDRLSDCALRHVITQHDAFGYLGMRYRFELHPVSGLSPEAEPSASTVQRIIDLMREHDIGFVFVEGSGRPDVMAAIARETGAKVRVLSPLESLTADERAASMDYVDVMERNLDALAEAMQCA